MKSIRELIPWRSRSQRDEDIASAARDPFLGLQRQIDQLFEDFGSRFGLLGGGESFGGYLPAVDISENDKEILVKAELPGLDENDLDVSLSGSRLVIRGEKKQESEQREGSWYRKERHFGSFQRSIELPCEVHEDQIRASYRQGVLHITLPKSEAARQNARKIAVH